MPRLYQYGLAGTPKDHREFFQFPPVSLDEMRAWIKDGAGDDAIGLGAVVNEKGTIVGELVMPGGKQAYMIGKDGQAKPVPENYKVTFAQVGCMQPEQKVELDVMNKADLQQKLATLLPEEKRGAYMVRLTGEFPDITFRTVDTNGEAVQTLPQLLDQKNSFTFDYHDKKAYQLVGVFSKKNVVENGVTFDHALNPDGTPMVNEILHLHGIDATHHKGGHLNDFNGPAHVAVQIMPITQWLTATREAAQAQQPSAVTWKDRMMQRAAISSQAAPQK